jgi:hypothetical protein
MQKDHDRGSAGQRPGDEKLRSGQFHASGAIVCAEGLVERRPPPGRDGRSEARTQGARVSTLDTGATEDKASGRAARLRRHGGRFAQLSPANVDA